MRTFKISTFVSLLLVSSSFAQVTEWVFNPDTNHWYGLTEQVWHGITNGDVCSDEVDTWLDAQVYAESIGGYLAVINSDLENQWIVDTFIGREVVYEVFWFGMSDWSVETEWVWVNGDPVEYTNWQGIQPDDALGGEDCIAMYGSPYLGEWNDLGCTSDWYILPALVELEEEPVSVALSNWSTVKSAYR